MSQEEREEMEYQLEQEQAWYDMLVEATREAQEAYGHKQNEEL